MPCTPYALNIIEKQRVGIQIDAIQTQNLENTINKIDTTRLQ